MKKIFFAAIAVMVFGFTNAQSNAQGTMHASVRGGFGFGSAKQEFNDGDLKFNNIMANFGADFQYGIAEQFSAGIGVEYGVNVLTYKDSDYSDSEDVVLSGIKIKLNGRYYFVNKDRFNFYAGPSIGFSSLKDQTDYYDEFGEDIDAKYSGINYGLNTGINFYFTDFFGGNVELGYEGSSLNGKDDADGVKLNMGGARIMAGVAFKF